MAKLWRWSLAGVAAVVATALVVAAATIALLYRAIEPESRVTASAVITPAHIDRAARLFMQHDPRRLMPGDVGALALRQDDIATALDYAGQRLAATHAEWTIAEGSARLRTSTRLPATPRGSFLNVEVVLRQDGPLPRIESLRMGDLAVPPPIATVMLRVALWRLSAASPGASTALDSIDRIALTPGRLDLAYTWRRKASAPGGMRIWSKDEQARIDDYLAVLDKTFPALAADPAQNAEVRPNSAGHSVSNVPSPAPGPSTPVPLFGLMKPLFQAASERSRGDGDSPRENRAALIALALFVNAGEASATGLAPAGRATLPAGGAHAVALNGRTDTAQHFTVSAAIAAVAGAPFADAVGLYKELADADGGSGFSFNDLAADRAGTRFGDMAATDHAAAAGLQRRFGPGQPEWALLPPVDDLPEGMQKPAFERRFGGQDGSGTRVVRADIERRLASLPLYR